MKKLTQIAVLIMVLMFLGGTIAFADSDVQKAKMKAGTKFLVYHAMMGAVAVELAEDTTITIVKIHKQLENKKTGVKKDFVEFSLSYDKPTIVCSKHGKDTYEMYKMGLGHDSAFVELALVTIFNQDA